MSEAATRCRGPSWPAATPEGIAFVEVYAQAELQSLAVAFTTELTETRSLAFTLNQALNEPGTRLDVTLSQRSGSRSWGLTAGLDTESGMSLGLSFSHSFGRLPYGGWQECPETLTSAAMTSVQVFLDKNGDGKRDAGEPPLRDVGFFVNDSSGRTVTDSNGVALLTGLPAYEPARLRISRSTLEDPMWVPARDDLVVRGRPGASGRLLMPVTPTGEVNGTVYGTRSGERCGQGAVDLELVNAAGEVVKTARSAYDGFYCFSEVPVGSYTVRTRLGGSLKVSYEPCEQGIVIQGDDPVVDGADLVLRQTGPSSQIAVAMR